MTDKSLVAAFLLLLFFATPFNRMWAQGGHIWLLPYWLWLVIIILLALAWWSDKDGGAAS